MLRQIREASEPAEPQAVVAPEQIRVPFFLDAASSLERAENPSSGPSVNKSEEREINDRQTEEEKDKSQELGAGATVCTAKSPLNPSSVKGASAEPEPPQSWPSAFPSPVCCCGC